MGAKTCRKCGKDSVAFSRNRSSPDGLQAWCKTCMRRYRLWTRYGLTPEDRERMEEAQGFLCALCRQVFPVHLDHDHSCCPGQETCGKCVRGLLCNRCNTLVGYYEHDPNTFNSVVAYVESWRVPDMPVA